MSPLIVALVVGVAAYLIIMIAFPKAAPESKNKNIKSALERLYEENRTHEASQAEVMREQLQEESALVRTIFSLPLMDKLHEAGLQAGYQGNMKQLLVIMMLGFLIGMAISLAIGGGPIGFIFALVLAYYLPFRHSRKKVHKRNRSFIDQFPDALDMIVRSVRSGFPLSTALQMLAENAEEPVRSEFRIVVDDIALGRSLSQSLNRLSVRINEPDIRFFVVVLSVQQETGGNLSEIIGNLSNVIRKRKQLRHRIKALTSEGKATGWILGALPVFIFVALWFIQPEYLSPFFTDQLGQVLFGSVLALMALAFFVVKQMINIDI